MDDNMNNHKCYCQYDSKYTNGCCRLCEVCMHPLADEKGTAPVRKLLAQ